MALIKCSECGKEISDKASCCPKCGAPVEVHKWECSESDNMISEEPCLYCGNSQLSENTNAKSHINITNATQEVAVSNRENSTVSKHNKYKKLWMVLGIIAAIIGITVLFIKLSSLDYPINNINSETSIINMGSIGNKITVDGTVAYVAGENKILVPYDFVGNFSECNNAVYDKSLKGCENPRLPSNETDDLPEEVAREIISFYGDIGGFWTSLEAEQANIEIAGYDLGSLHYAGIMDNFFRVGADNVATLVWGYCLNSTSDSTIMGLLVLYDVTNGFEFTDVEDTADPNYSSAPTLYDEVMAESDGSQRETESSTQTEDYSANSNDESSDNTISPNESNTISDNDDNYIEDTLPIGKYKLSNIFSPFEGWFKVVDSNGNYNDKWKSKELDRIKSSLGDYPSDEIENCIQRHRNAFKSVQPTMYIEVSDEWMRCYNIYSEYELCKGIIGTSEWYDSNDGRYGHDIDNYSSIDDSMGKLYPLSAEIYSIGENGLANSHYWQYDFQYYPDVKGIGVYIKDCDYGYEMLFTLQ